MLTLDDALAQHLPEFERVRADAGAVREVTLRRVLTHLSGLDGETPALEWERLNFPEMRDMLDALPRTRLAIAPDTQFKYSNLGYSLLGEVVARVSGLPFREFVVEQVLRPAGMRATRFSLDASESNAAQGYFSSRHRDGLEPAPPVELRGMAPCGGLWSNVEDLARWGAAQWPGSHADVLAPSSIEEAHRPAFLEPDWSVGYGLGWRATRFGDEILHGHGGGLHGYTTMLLYSRARRVGVACLGNCWPHPGLLALAGDLLMLLIQSERAAAAASAKRAGPRVEGEDARWAGQYVAWPEIAVQVSWRDGRLFLERSPLSDYSLHAGAELSRLPGTAAGFEVRGGRAAGERLTFAVDPDGRAEFTLAGWRYRRG